MPSAYGLCRAKQALLAPANKAKPLLQHSAQSCLSLPGYVTNGWNAWHAHQLGATDGGLIDLVGLASVLGSPLCGHAALVQYSVHAPAVDDDPFNQSCLVPEAMYISFLPDRLMIGRFTCPPKLMRP